MEQSDVRRADEPAEDAGQAGDEQVAGTNEDLDE
jgi:hypothetical protein